MPSKSENKPGRAQYEWHTKLGPLVHYETNHDCVKYVGDLARGDEILRSYARFHNLMLDTGLSADDIEKVVRNWKLE